jgi:hypothetical protein
MIESLAGGWITTARELLADTRKLNRERKAYRIGIAEAVERMVPPGEAGRAARCLCAGQVVLRTRPWLRFVETRFGYNTRISTWRPAFLNRADLGAHAAS